MKQSHTSMIGVIVDKSKATKSVNNFVSAFPENSYIMNTKNVGKDRRYMPKSLVELLKNIMCKNET